MRFPFLEFAHQVVDLFVFRDEVNGADELHPGDIRFGQMRKQVFDVEDADDFILRPTVNGDAGVAGFHNLGTELFPLLFRTHGLHVGPGGHNLLGILGAEGGDALKDALLLVGAVFVGCQLQHLLQVGRREVGIGHVHALAYPISKSNEWLPNRRQGLPSHDERPGHELGELQAVVGGVDLGNHFTEQDNEKRHGTHVQGPVHPRL